LSLLPALGRALFEAGQTQTAQSVLSEAAETARVTGQQAIGVDAAVALSALRLQTSPVGAGQEDVWRVLDEAIPFYETSGDEAGLARALGIAGTLRFWRGESAAAIEDLARAAHHARRTGERAPEIDSVQYELMAMLNGPTPVGEALARVEALGAAAERNRALKVHVLRVGAHLEAMRGHFTTARDLIARAKELAAELGLEVTLARIALQAGPIELLAGDAAAAEREMRPALEALERMEAWGFAVSIVPPLVDALLEQGRGDEGRQLTEFAERLAAPEDVDGQAGWRRARGKVLAHRGNLDEAERLAREATAIAGRSDWLDLRAQAHADLGEVLHLAGKAKEAASAMTDAIRLYELKGNVVAAERLRRLLLQRQADA
jgi:ATP/maltotriose-dependent transcriptional regulator MalT